MILHKNSFLRRTFSLLFLLALSTALVLTPLSPAADTTFAESSTATLSSALSARIAGLADSADAGMVIVAFNTASGLQDAHFNALRAVGVTGGHTFPTLGMVAQPMTAGQVRALSTNPAVRSLWSNDRMMYYMHQARVLGGVQKVQTDAAMTFGNGGMPVSGAGDFSVLVIDSGVDATHADLQYGTKVIQNVQTPVAAGTLPGFTPHVSIENVPNTDQTVGHGTHCAGIIGGTGLRSGGLYTGVAPGAKIIGAGLGAGQTDSSSLKVALDTSSAEVFTGQAGLSLASHNADLADLPLATSPIALQAQVNNFADPVFSKIAGRGRFSV